MAQYFNLTLDTTAPSGGSITVENQYNAAGSVGLNAGIEGAAFMKVWVNQTAAGTSADLEIPASWEPYSNSKSLTFSEQGTNYVHALFMDEVGNVSAVVDSSAFTYDSVAPVISAVSINSGADFTNDENVVVRVTVSDATSDVDYVTLSGDIVETGDNAKFIFTATDLTNGYKDCAVTLTSTDGSKSVAVTATDVAGNTSTSSSDSIALDTSEASGVLILRNADDTANLGAYVNNANFAAAITTSDTDVVAYKIWGDMVDVSTEPNSWATATFTEGRMLIDNLTFTSNEGTKTIYAKIQDAAGNETTLTQQSTILDLTPPTVTLAADTTIISAETGFDTVVFTYGASDAAGLGNYQLKLGNDVVKQGAFTNGATESVTEAELVAVSAGEGVKNLVLYVEDGAGNVGQSSAVSITVDLTAPTGTIAADSYYDTTSIELTVAGSDTGGAAMSKMKVWLDLGEPSTWDDYEAGTVILTGVAEGQHTAHVKFMDSVGNASAAFNSESFIVDITAPTGTVSCAPYTNSRNITVTLSASDDKSGIEVSGIAQMKVWENGATEPAWETYAGTKSLELSTGDGQKIINAKFKDAAGNEMTGTTTCSTVLDTDEPDVTLVLTKTDGTTQLPASVAALGFNARIGRTNETQDSPIVAYQLTGDFTGSSTDWITFTQDENQDYMTVSGLQFTSGDGLKTITALLKDEAGNISATGASVSVTLNSQAPIIDCATPDYNIVSKEHTERLSSTGAVITGKYNDLCIFTWTANKALQAFKVCVNEAEQTASEANAIGTTHGSINMSGGAVEANTDITSVICGSDFAATDAVNDTDGAYEIIVYGQDEGGNWSAVHQLTPPAEKPQNFTLSNGDNFTLKNGDNFTVQPNA